MKKFKRVAIALITIVALIFWAAPLTYIQAADAIFFTGINDRLLTLEYATAPVMIDNVIYVPYNVFHDNALGSMAFYHRTEQIVQILRDKTELLFNLSTDDSTGSNGEKGDKLVWKAIVRDSVPFVPAEFTARYLGLAYSRFQTALDADVIRITNGTEVYTDPQFALAGYYRMSDALAAYKPNVPPPTDSPYYFPTDPPPPTLPASPVPTEVYYSDVFITLNFYGLYEDTLNYKATYWLTETDISENAALARKLYGTGNKLAAANDEARPYLREAIGFLEPNITPPEDGLPEALTERQALKKVKELNHGAEAALYLSAGENYRELLEYLRDGLYSVYTVNS
ncbi:MAG: hypothetical protein LBM98_01650 [Oscillospiraceae bacterium]|jgi:hypothetical protein|nr:hypothetical protein [Oscillospiraceae bacterium]